MSQLHAFYSFFSFKGCLCLTRYLTYFSLFALHLPPPIHSQMDDETCAICRECFEEDKINHTTTKCGHRFHTDCLSSWIAARSTTAAEAKCPICRQDFFDSALAEISIEENARCMFASLGRMHSAHGNVFCFCLCTLMAIIHAISGVVWTFRYFIELLIKARWIILGLLLTYFGRPGIEFLRDVLIDISVSK